MFAHSKHLNYKQKREKWIWDPHATPSLFYVLTEAEYSMSFSTAAMAIAIAIVMSLVRVRIPHLFWNVFHFISS